jgi:hypothetical protein
MGDHPRVCCDTSGRRLEGGGAKTGGNSVSRHIAIVGARRRTDRETIDHLVAGLPGDTVIVSGGANGPDTWAAEAARKRGLATKIFRPNLHDVDALSQGQITRRYRARNQQIVARPTRSSQRGHPIAKGAPRTPFAAHNGRGFRLRSFRSECHG